MRTLQGISIMTTILLLFGMIMIWMGDAYETEVYSDDTFTNQSIVKDANCEDMEVVMSIVDRVIVTIIRLEESSEGTFGVLLINGVLFCNTLEPADEENKVNVSSIPAQQYTCQLHNSPKHGRVFKVLNVPGRTNILFHSGAIAEHTLGCILLGSNISKLRGRRTLYNSGRTLSEFMHALAARDRFFLTIREAY